MIHYDNTDLWSSSRFSLHKITIFCFMVSDDSGLGPRWYMISITIGETLGGITK
jgi:hypothetical protein